MFLFFSLQTHPMYKAFVTVATGQCLGVFGSCSTDIVPGGACVLCNLSLIVLMTKWSSGTGYDHVVIQRCMVNHLPCLSYISLRYSMTWESAGERDIEKERGRYFKGHYVPLDTHANRVVLTSAFFCMFYILRWKEEDDQSPWHTPRL